MCKELLCQISKAMGTKCPKPAVIETIIYRDPVPNITPCGCIDMVEGHDICKRIVEQYGNQADIFMPDVLVKIYKYDDVVNDKNLEFIDMLEYKVESHDCDDFAAEAFGAGYGLAWSNVHALNWFIDENKKFWFIEPQTRKIADKLDTWQGKEIRFLLGR